MPLLKTYILTGHLQIAGVALAASTGEIRCEIKATSQQEAETKFKAFLNGKAWPVVTSCQEKNPLKDVYDQLREIFK